MAGKKVYFAPGTVDKTNGAGRRVPTPRFLKHGRDAPTSEDQQYRTPERYVRRPRRSSSNSSVGSRGPYDEQGISRRTQKSPARRTPLRTVTGKIDGRGSPKERQRKSLQASSMNRTPDGKFARSKSSPRASTGTSGEPRLGSSGGNARHGEAATRPSYTGSTGGSSPEVSFLDTSFPVLPEGRYVKEFLQTPKVQRDLKKFVERRRGSGTRLDFGTSSGETSEEEKTRAKNDLRPNYQYEWEKEDDEDTY